MIRWTEPWRRFGLVAALLISLALGASLSEAGKRDKSESRADKREDRAARKEARKETRKAERESPSDSGSEQSPSGEVDKEPQRAQEKTDPVPTEPEPVEILALGEGSERFWVAFEGKYMSIWANRASADKLLEELEAYGGPKYTCFEPLTRPVTLSMVHVRMEDVLRKMLDAYDFAYIYEGGRLAHVRILNYVPGRKYKVSDPIVSRLDWTEQVLGESSR